MTASSALSFDAIDDALQQLGVLSAPSEAHGSLCGLLCLLGASAQSQWIAETLATGAQTSPPDAETTELPDSPDVAGLLAALASATATALAAGDMSFQPLLPAEDASLEQRTEALAAWCQGFNYGLALAVRIGDADAALKGEPVAEIVRDFAELAQLGHVEDEIEGEGEVAWVELLEYVRVSAQLVFEELAAVRQQIDSAVRH